MTHTTAEDLNGVWKLGEEGAAFRLRERCGHEVPEAGPWKRGTVYVCSGNGGVQQPETEGREGVREVHGWDDRLDQSSHLSSKKSRFLSSDEMKKH